jgi:hypothetical protein
MIQVKMCTHSSAVSMDQNDDDVPLFRSQNSGGACAYAQVAQAGLHRWRSQQWPCHPEEVAVVGCVMGGDRRRHSSASHDTILQPMPHARIVQLYYYWTQEKTVDIGPVWYSFTSSFTSSFTTSIAKQATLCPTLWPASLKTHSHRVKHMAKLPKHGSLPRSWSCSWSCFLKTALQVKLSCAKRTHSFARSKQRFA